MLTSAMLVGTAVGLVAGIASMLLVTATIRPDAVSALVVGVPSAIGLLRVRARSVTLTVSAIGGNPPGRASDRR